ncbi:hypothetical protein A5624_10170 [Mycobacterium sp. 1482292.6]|nr:hypothetical protein A5624_10170 [Mycobacterium sp. 1482292.6]
MVLEKSALWEIAKGTFFPADSVEQLILAHLDVAPQTQPAASRAPTDSRFSSRQRNGQRSPRTVVIAPVPSLIKQISCVFAQLDYRILIPSGLAMSIGFLRTCSSGPRR